MNNRLKQALLLVFCFALVGNTGCTTTQSVNASSEAMAEKKIVVGDKVTVHYVSGHSEPLKLTNIGEKSLSGILDDGRSVELDYDNLLLLEHKEVDVLKTAGATVGIVVLGAVVVAASGAAAVLAVAGGM